MVTFTTELLLKPLAHRKWEVMMPFVVQTETLGEIIVEAGFVCDLNSIPRPVWFVSTPADWTEAGVVHDYLYAKGVPRDKADKVYREILEALGMGKFRRGARYWALRVFGGGPYRSHEKERAAASITPASPAPPES